MADNLLPLALPPCPVCGGQVVSEKGERGCSRCGRGFTAVVESSPPGAVYRATALVHLDTLRERRPLGPGLRIGKAGALDVSIGGPSLCSREWQTISRYAGIFALALGCMSMTTNGDVELWSFLPGLLLLTIDVVLRRAKYDHLTVDAGRLTLQRFRGKECLTTESVNLESLIGAHDAGDHIRVDLDDGRALKVGAGLRARRHVRRWVARRMADLIPARDERGVVGSPLER